MSLGGGGEPLGEEPQEGVSFQGVLCLGWLSFPPSAPHVVSRGVVGAREGGQDSSQPLPALPRPPAGLSWRRCCWSPGPQRQALCRGGQVGVQGTGLSQAGDRAEPNAVSCHSGFSSSFIFSIKHSLYFVLFCFASARVNLEGLGAPPSPPPPAVKCSVWEKGWAGWPWACV